MISAKSLQGLLKNEINSYSDSSVYYTPNSSRSSPSTPASKSTGKRRRNLNTNRTADSRRQKKSIAISARQKRVRTASADSMGRKKSRANLKVTKKTQATSVNALANDLKRMTLGKKALLTNNNEKTLMKDIERTPCTKHIKNLKNLKDIFSVLNGVNYVQGYHFIALQLLRKKSVQSAYKVFGSEGMKRFLMLKPEMRPKLMRSVSPLFPPLGRDFNSFGNNPKQVYTPNLNNLTDLDILLFSIASNFSQEFYIHNEACKHELLDFLLSPERTLNYSNDVSFFKEKDSFTMFYLFILRHLSIVITETIKQKKLSINELHDHQAFISKNNIEAKTIESVKSHIKVKNLEHYKYHCLAAFTVMLLDNQFGNIKTSSIGDHLQGAKGLVHVTNLPGPNSKSQSPNLQGIKPFWGEPLDIELKTVKIPSFIKFLSSRILNKLLIAYMTIYGDISYEGVNKMLKYFETVVYVDKNGEVISLLQALKKRTSLKVISSFKVFF